MFRTLLCICIALVIIPLLSCDNANNVSQTNDESQNSSQNSDENKLEILRVLNERWKEGYEEGNPDNIEKYMKSFWPEFQHVLDDGTILNIKEEEEATKRVFDKFKEIVMEIPDPTIDFLSETKAEVKTSYKIQFILKDNTSDQCVYEGYYAEGENTFTFRFDTTEDGKNEWRIARWKDKARRLD